MATPRWMRAVGIAVLVVVLLLTVLGIYWSRTPKTFWVNEFVDDGTHVVGYSTTDTLIRVASALVDKPGGYLSNDKMPPGVVLDNIPNWEQGVLTQVADLSRVLRNDYSRSQSQSKEDPDLVIAQEKFFSESNSWMFPPTERRFDEGIEALQRYRDRLSGVNGAAPDAQFYARADNLREWLACSNCCAGTNRQRYRTHFVVRD